ncbi:MAG: hypothetical protein Q7S33_03550 [Nanoarchaeota archaeon]|nr:hypothetical protein [Nanoarchaeota archaeon]
MVNKKYVGGALAIGVLALGIALCPGKRQEEVVNPIETIPVQQPVQVVSDSTGFEYIVQKGDYLSKIVYEELGIRGRKGIYERCLEIQTLNNLGPERDISMVVDGQLVSGQDGYADVLYPNEKLTLNKY